jgi:hypothetical protein
MIQRGKAPLSLTTAFVEHANKQITGLIESAVAIAAAVAQHSLTAGLPKDRCTAETGADGAD